MNIIVLYFMVSFILAFVDLFIIPGGKELFNQTIDEADENIEDDPIFSKIGKILFKIAIRIIFVALLILSVIPSKVLALINNK